MRKKERIPIVMKRIEEIWKQYPDYRLGQLICNVYQDPMLFYVEDDKLIEALNQFYVNTNEEE